MQRLDTIVEQVNATDTILAELHLPVYIHTFAMHAPRMIAATMTMSLLEHQGCQIRLGNEPKANFWTIRGGRSVAGVL